MTRPGLIYKQAARRAAPEAKRGSVLNSERIIFRKQAIDRAEQEDFNMLGSFDSSSNKQGGPAPHPWIVAQANYMLSRPWDVALWSSWWWATYLSTLQSMGIDMRAITDACGPEAYCRSLDIGMAAGSART